jgi:hypothetical protein
MRHATSEAVVVSHKRGALPLACVMGAALLAFATATAHAQSTGIATCDNFLAKYETCVTSKLPEAQRATYKTQLDQMRKSWVDMSKNPATKSTMEASCKQSMDAMKTALQAYGCTF